MIVEIPDKHFLEKMREMPSIPVNARGALKDRDVLILVWKDGRMCTVDLAVRRTMLKYAVALNAVLFDPVERQWQGVDYNGG